MGDRPGRPRLGGLNATLFVGYIMLGHKAAEGGASGGVERLGAAMAIAFLL